MLFFMMNSVWIFEEEIIRDQPDSPLKWDDIW